MSKTEFFHQLRQRLRGLPYEEQKRIIGVYEDLFLQAEANGKSEQEIVMSLGYQSEWKVPIPAYAAPSPAEAGIRMVIASIALGLFNLIFILGPFIGAAAVLFSLSIVAVVMVLSPVFIAVGTGIPDSGATILLEVFSVLTLTGLGVLLSIGMWKADRFFLALLKKYTQLNYRLIKGD